MSKACTLKGRQQNFIFQRGLTTSCCRARHEQLVNFVDLKELQSHWQREAQKLIHGDELPGCQHCWNYEHQGITSYRQQENKTKQPMAIIALFFDNLCNQMCSYCGPNYSSVWENSINDHGQFINVSNNVKFHQQPIINGSTIDVQSWINDISEYVNSLPDESCYITLLGGEPLMQLKNMEILQKFNLKKFKYLGITTNLNPPNPKFLHRMFETIPVNKIQISVSIDTTPDYNHVPRSGFDKNRFLENFNYLIEKNARNTVFLSVLSVLSALDLSNYIKWINSFDLGIVFEINIVNNPECLHPKYLPWHIKNQILEQCQGLDVPKHVIQTLSQDQEQVDHILIEQYNYLTQYFTRAGINPDQVDHELFKQYWTWLKDFNENSTSI